MMRINRKSLTIGLVGLGMIGAVAAGGVATAAPATPTPTPTASVCTDDGQFGNGHGMGVGARAPITAAATYLGLTQADLQSRLQSGKSLADVAKAQGKSVTGLQDAMVAAVKVSLDADTSLTAAQKAARLALMKSEIATMVTAVHADGDGFGMGAGMMGGRMGAGIGMGSAGMGTGNNDMGMGSNGNGAGGGMGMHGGS